MTKKNNRKIKSEILSAAQTGAAQETVQRYGSAIKEHLVAYSGVDNETGKTLTRSLHSVSESQVNTDCAEINIKQQSGFSAEVKYVANENAKSIINGEPVHTARTDDVGRVNDELYDHFIYDKNGQIIGKEQMKFIGKDPKSCFSKLLSKKYEKYHDADAIITVPSDFYDGVLQEADAHIEKLNRQIKRAKELGKQDIIDKKERELQKIYKIKRNLKNSGISNTKAKFTRLHPKLSTALDVTHIAHKAGVEQAKITGTISGVVSIVTNCIAVINGEKDIKSASYDVAKDTGTGMVASYATAFSGSIVKGGLQNGSEIAQGLSKTNLPAIVVTSAIEIGKTLQRYLSGEIDGVECLEELGEKGSCQISSALFATIGANLTSSIVGGIAGSMFGYALAGACYKTLKNSLKEAKIAREVRIQIEKDCEAAIENINAFHEKVNNHIKQYLCDYQQTFSDALTQLSIANETKDIDKFIGAANKISTKLGGKVPFNSYNEFDSLMNETSYTFRH